MSLSLEASGLSEEELVELANEVREVGEDDWQALVRLIADTEADVVLPQPAGPVSVLSEGRAGDQSWQLVAYEIDDTAPDYADSDYCLKVRPVEHNQSCVSRRSLDQVVTAGSYFMELGPRAELDGRTIFTGTFNRDVASVRLLFDTGATFEVDTVGVAQGFGVHLALTLPDDVASATAVLLDAQGDELQRQEFSDLQSVLG